MLTFIPVLCARPIIIWLALHINFRTALYVHLFSKCPWEELRISLYYHRRNDTDY